MAEVWRTTQEGEEEEVRSVFQTGVNWRESVSQFLGSSFINEILYKMFQNKLKN